ncbi:hypothetical protein Bca52824_054005 [Brassica carinata]|uniref:Uncharacterized protein n=1 Tax=Brassica carinata TaxID=52824 RepID=A0A8X7R6H3_BRACI|nr:hypothetical protein Bca52824_054005 [Brassica carinata]
MLTVAEIAPVASVEPFGIPSRSIGQLRGNRTFVGRVVLQFLALLAGLKSFDFCYLGCILLKSGDYGNIVLRPDGSGIYPPGTRSNMFALCTGPALHNAYVLSDKATVLLHPLAWRLWVDMVSCDFGPRLVHMQGLTWVWSRNPLFG